MHTLIKQYHEAKTPIFINGLGAGRIANIEDDYISFEVVRAEDGVKGKKLFRETTNIRISSIDTISTGEKELPKSEAEKQIEADLEGL